MATMPIPPFSKRMQREYRTVELMILRFCRDRHGSSGEAPCSECQALLAYARRRLQHCYFQEHKTTCGNCPVHCYSPSMREKIRQVMRYAGPRMLLSHPVLAIRHMLDGLRKPRPHD
jgi:hypothetical protein